jgi:exosome complex exonuclease DIS3/RRP44
LIEGELKSQIDSGTVLQGVYSVNRDYWAEAVVHAGPGKSAPIFIPTGRYYSNRAVDGDVVAVQLLPRSEWKAPSSRIVPATENNADEVDAIMESTNSNVGTAVFY